MNAVIAAPGLLADPRLKGPTQLGISVGANPSSPRRACREVPMSGWDTLHAGFRLSGGMLPADVLASLMRPVINQPITQLGRWIVRREVITVATPTQTLLPVFQFAPGLKGLRVGLDAVLLELVDVFDGWEMALWFASDNCTLGGSAPADCLAQKPDEVLETARLDRFVVAGS